MSAIPQMFGTHDQPSRPLVAGGLRGYRCWRFQPLTARPLLSTAWPVSWAEAGQKNHATCRCNNYLRAVGKNHDAPHDDCACGFYGWYRPEDHRIVKHDVFGVIKATGRICLGTHGFRAERAEIEAVTTTSRDINTSLAARGYRTFPTIAALVRAYPPDDMTSLIDHTCGDECEMMTALAIAMQNARTSIQAATAAIQRTADLLRKQLGTGGNG